MSCCWALCAPLGLASRLSVSVVTSLASLGLAALCPSLSLGFRSNTHFLKRVFLGLKKVFHSLGLGRQPFQLSRFTFHAFRYQVAFVTQFTSYYV